MWIAKIKYKHDCILGNRCEKFKINLQSVILSIFKDKGKIITSSMHHLIGNTKEIEKFIKDLKKDKNVIKVERKKNAFFLLEKAKVKAIKFYTPKIIFIKPVLIDDKGHETWEIGSWEKEELSKFIKLVRNQIKDFKLLKFINSKIDDVFFPKLMPNLTLKQQEVIELAIREGYYTHPRKTNLRKLSKILGLSLSTYQQHLRIAENKLMPNLFSYI
jgi:predicted DNA binding protein